jgi:hypothetical protein
MDLTTFIQELAPAYASDLMVTGQGTVTLAWDQVNSAPLISVSNAGTGAVYNQAATLVPSGTIQSGHISYDIPEYKTALRTSATALPMAGKIGLAVAVDGGPYVNCGSLDVGTIEQPLPVPQLQGKHFDVQITLTRDSITGASPFLSRWQLEAFPQIASETTISAVLMLSSNNLVDGAEAWLDTYAEYYYLDQIRRNQTIVWYVEGPLSAQVLIESIDFLPERERGDFRKGYTALGVVTLKTINGFSYTIPSVQ